MRDRLTARRLNNVTLIAGGPHPSGDLLQTLTMGFDVVVVGEGEKSLPFGMPGETEEDQALTRKMIEDLGTMGARIHSHAFMPLAGTPWRDASPGDVDPKTGALLARLTGRGQQFGQWREQRDACREVAGLRGLRLDRAPTE